MAAQIIQQFNKRDVPKFMRRAMSVDSTYMVKRRAVMQVVDSQLSELIKYIQYTDIHISY